MARPWFRADPELFARVREETTAAFPLLRLGVREGKVVLAGPFPLVHEEVEWDRYEIEVVLPDDFPDGAPLVFETAGRIKRLAQEHAYASGRVCLFVPGERWKYWPEGESLVAFLQGAVRSYLIAHAIYECTGEWVFGERPHGAAGVYEAYREMTGMPDDAAAMRFLEALATPIAPKGHHPCPCGSGQRLRACHAALVRDLRSKITPAEAAESIRYINRDGQVAVAPKR